MTFVEIEPSVAAKARGERGWFAEIQEWLFSVIYTPYREQPYQADYIINGAPSDQRCHLGLFATRDDAMLACQAKAIELERPLQ